MCSGPGCSRERRISGPDTFGTTVNLHLYSRYVIQGPPQEQGRLFGNGKGEEGEDREVAIACNTTCTPQEAFQHLSAPPHLWFCGRGAVNGTIHGTKLESSPAPPASGTCVCMQACQNGVQGSLSMRHLWACFTSDRPRIVCTFSALWPCNLLNLKYNV